MGQSENLVMSDNALYIQVVISNPWFDMSDNFFAPMVMPEPAKSSGSRMLRIKD